MTEPTDRNITCYSASEDALMHRSQALRGRWLRPLLDALARLHCRAGHLTLFSLLAGLAFCPLLLAGRPLAALGFLLLHVLLDGLDGPLARHLGRASNRGSFTDTMADQAVVTFSTLTLMEAGYAGLWPGALYLIFYTVVVLFALARNALAIPYSWLVRPRFFVFACIPVELWLQPGSLNGLLWIVSTLLAWKTLTGFIQIRRRL